MRLALQGGGRPPSKGGALNLVATANAWPAALALFVFINAGLLLVLGVRHGGDTGMYLDGARALLSGEPLSVRQPSYAAYIAVIALFQKIGAGLTGVALAQLAAATAAAAMVGRMAAELAGPVAAVIAVLLFAIDVDTNRWHAYILSDSLFLSALAVAVWLVYRAAIDPRLPRFAAAGAALVAAALIRPEGWFLIPAAAVLWIARVPMPSSRRLLSVATLATAAVILAGLVVPRLGGNLAAVGPADMLRQGQTIWDYDGLRMAMPADPVFADGQATSQDAVIYAVRHPLETAALMAARVAVHFAHVRPYFSDTHNIVVLLWLVPIYLLSIWAMWRRRTHVLTHWCLAALATQVFVVSVTHADWDGRYLAHMMPLLYPFAAASIAARVPGLEARV